MTDPLALAAAAVSPKTPKDGAPYVVIPEAFRLAGLEHLLPHPVRPRGTFRFKDLKGWQAYMRTYGNGAVVFYDLSDGGWMPTITLTGILNHHEVFGKDVSPGWCDWRAVAHFRIDNQDPRQILEEIAKTHPNLYHGSAPHFAKDSHE